MDSAGKQALIPLMLIALTGCPFCQDPLYESRTDDPVVRLARDESPHCFGGAEWWYYTGRLRAEDGRTFGVQTVIFHQPQFPTPIVTEFWVAHYAVLDVDSGEFTCDQAVLIGPQPTPKRGFDLFTPFVQMRGADGQDRIRATMRDGRFGLDLALRDAKGPVLHGADGYVPYGARGMAFYYSRPRMNAGGTLVVSGEPTSVSGQFWFDRQWGLDLNNPRQPWDWFSIRLDDGTDIMLFEFPAPDGPVAFGTLIPPSGEPQTLAGTDFAIRRTARWRSPRTNIAYDVAWEIEIPTAGLSLTLAAATPDQEIIASRTTLNVYWEGLCAVEGFQGDAPLSGHAYVEQANGGS
jgi:predicted secreted hydrolase